MSLIETMVQSLRQAIEEGRYAPGDQLPSIRECAERWGCNKLTAKKAYDRLKAEGYIENSVGRGSFVKYPRRIESERGLFPFQVASIGEDLFPLDAVRRLTGELFAEVGVSLFAAAPPGGNSRCLDALSSFYRTPRDRTVVISGAQQGLDLAGKLFSDSLSEVVLFEDPTYSGAVNLFRPKRFVPLLENGPDLDLLEKHAREGIEAFYAMPQIHNPTGISYTPEVMKRIAELATTYGFLIIEDDYLSEFLPSFFDDPPMRFLDLIPERTIYIKSLSKVTAPGIRIGILVAPGTLREDLLFSKFTADIGTSSFMQHLVASLVESGTLKESILINRKICEDRRRRLEILLARYPFLSFTAGRLGYNIWVTSTIDPSLPSAPWAGGENFSFDPASRYRFRLSFMGMSEERFVAGLKYLGGVFDALGNDGPKGIF
ncbi:aminotransferase-like domain-containing protein [Sediminispirochaeta smaragdinae]|uniref:Transcriptional regulator, GntR family n=1 Tax=Sediminispirochaeta smaragdinae (strain DSM 11293 / JCM 15392 / SEBR 4228) TaxID=573413 RepID=E1R7R4_SEDSS|nr:PLP-dependent aminotransferase family protein [Sediminispirochaeta smaragdinae]ADK82769.1 transcriptional regulator, GntR family [Sediminispirochaeta smaragdinae DSM 11293]